MYNVIRGKYDYQSSEKQLDEKQTYILHKQRRGKGKFSFIFIFTNLPCSKKYTAKTYSVYSSVIMLNVKTNNMFHYRERLDGVFFMFILENLINARKGGIDAQTGDPLLSKASYCFANFVLFYEEDVLPFFLLFSYCSLPRVELLLYRKLRTSSGFTPGKTVKIILRDFGNYTCKILVDQYV